MGRETFDALVESAKRHCSFYSVRTEDGKEWHLVGRNASHEFYVALDADGALWKRSVGEGEDEELDISIRRCAADEVPYVGHW